MSIFYFLFIIVRFISFRLETEWYLRVVNGFKWISASCSWPKIPFHTLWKRSFFNNSRFIGLITHPFVLLSKSNTIRTYIQTFFWKIVQNAKNSSWWKNLNKKILDKRNVLSVVKWTENWVFKREFLSDSN